MKLCRICNIAIISFMRIVFVVTLHKFMYFKCIEIDMNFLSYDFNLLSLSFVVKIL